MKLFRSKAIVLFAFLAACTQREPLPPSKVAQLYDFSYQVNEPEGAGVIQAFSDEERLYIHIIRDPAPAADLQVTDEAGNQLLYGRIGDVLLLSHQELVRVTRLGRESIVRKRRMK